MLFAFLIMTAFTAMKFGPKALIVDKRTLVACAVLGVVSNGIYNMFYTMAIGQCRHRRFGGTAKHCAYFYHRIFNADIPLRASPF